MKYSEELNDRRVLVTGANGFVGSHLVERLVEYGSDVVAFIEATPENRQKNLQNVRDEVELVQGDLQDLASVRKAIQLLSGYEDVLIFHLGAQAHVGESWERPYETVNTNVLGTLNLLESVRSLEVDVEKFNMAGTSEEYGNFDESKKESYRERDGAVVLDERAPVNPESIYGTSKVAADFLAQNYHEAYGLPTITTRMFNNYGPRQNPRFITGTVISQALKQDKVEVGNLEPKRDMCFVTDGVRGHIHATLEGSPGEVYGFGRGENITMQQWVEEILRIGEDEGFWEDIEVVQTEERFRPGDSDVQELRADSSKLNELTGWEPQIGWDEGLRKTIKWYAENEQRWRNQCDWS